MCVKSKKCDFRWGADSAFTRSTQGMKGSWAIGLRNVLPCLKVDINLIYILPHSAQTWILNPG